MEAMWRDGVRLHVMISVYIFVFARFVTYLVLLIFLIYI
jgi:hypothetical protein